MNSLSNIIFEEINEEYGYGLYLGIKVIIMKKNGYVNATKLCADGGKQFKNWLRLDHAQELIKYHENEENASAHFRASAIIIKNVENTLRGTYLHQDLIPHIASWVSAEFAIKVSRIVNEYVVSEYKKQLEKKDKIIENVSDRAVVKAEDKRKKHNFHLIRFDGCEVPRYKIIRGQPCNFPRQYRKIKNTQHTILQQFEDVPNSVNYGNRLKERLGIKFCADLSFVLPQQYDEEYLKGIMNEIHEERFYQ